MTVNNRAALLSRGEPERQPPPGSVTYRARGTALVVGDGDDVLEVAQRLSQRMHVVAFAPSLAGKPTGPRLALVGGRVVRVTGHLGRFRAAAALGHGQDADVGGFSPNADGYFDVVLDLSSTPLVRTAVAPPGYVAPRDPDQLALAVETLPTLQGVFHKPRFVTFDGRLCNHSAQGVKGCTRCLSACDAGALHSTGANIVFDPYLCQGCAGCTLSCPTGALAFDLPSSGPSERPLSESSVAIRAGTPASPRALVLYREGTDFVKPTPRSAEVSWWPLPALGALGGAEWLFEVAAGYDAVVLLDDPAMPPKARARWLACLSDARELLQALGLDADLVRLVTPADLAAALEGVRPFPRQRQSQEDLGPVNGKRGRLLLALKVLMTDTADVSARALSESAGLGAVRINEAKCTACLACARLCPTGALTGSTASTVRLMFDEGSCVQCELCVRGCPEDAVTLIPRASPLAMLQRVAPVLTEAARVSCTQCGEPFISRKVLARSVELLKAHPALAGATLRSLSVCPDCRAKALS